MWTRSLSGFMTVKKHEGTYPVRLTGGGKVAKIKEEKD